MKFVYQIILQKIFNFTNDGFPNIKTKPSLYPRQDQYSINTTRLNSSSRVKIFHVYRQDFLCLPLARIPDCKMTTAMIMYLKVCICNCLLTNPKVTNMKNTAAGKSASNTITICYFLTSKVMS